MTANKLVADGKRTALLPNPANPRKPWAAGQAATFAESLAVFGDLSGVVENVRTGRLVGGHKRTDQFAADAAAEVIITDRLEQPDATGTLAFGYVVSLGTRWAYRLVDWLEDKEAAANVAANKWGAEFDFGALERMLPTMNGFDLKLTGFSDAEWKEVKAANVPPTHSTGEVLARLKVTIAEPTFKVEDGEVWHCGPHVVACLDVFTDWPVWSNLLAVGSVFLPYAGPFVLLTEGAQSKRYVIVNPDPYLCGHIVDKWIENGGEEPHR